MPVMAGAGGSSPHDRRHLQRPPAPTCPARRARRAPGPNRPVISGTPGRAASIRATSAAASSGVVVCKTQISLDGVVLRRTARTARRSPCRASARASPGTSRRPSPSGSASAAAARRETRVARPMRPPRRRYSSVSNATAMWSRPATDSAAADALLARRADRARARAAAITQSPSPIDAEPDRRRVILSGATWLRRCARRFDRAAELVREVHGDDLAPRHEVLVRVLEERRRRLRCRRQLLRRCRRS